MKLFSFCLIGLCGFSLAIAEVKVTRGVEFAKVDGKALRLDLYQDSDSVEATPLIVWIHGGAWRGGSRKGMPLKDLVSKGYTIASVDYRLTPVAPFPANVHDIKTAIRFLKSNSGKYHFDPKRVFIAGASAGGHLASLVGLSNGVEKLDGKVESGSSVNSDVHGVVSFYGASNLSTILEQSTPHGLSVRVPALKLLLEGSPTEKPELARLASPVFHLDPKDPAVLLFHGDEDPQMPYAQSVELVKACKELGVSCELVPIKGGGHGGKGFYGPEMLEKVARFLENL